MTNSLRKKVVSWKYRILLLVSCYCFPLWWCIESPRDNNCKPGKHLWEQLLLSLCQPLDYCIVHCFLLCEVNRDFCLWYGLWFAFQRLLSSRRSWILDKPESLVFFGLIGLIAETDMKHNLGALTDLWWCSQGGVLWPILFLSRIVLGGTSAFFVIVCSKTPKSMVFINRNSNQQIQFLELILGLLTGPCLSQSINQSINQSIIFIYTR